MKQRSVAAALPLALMTMLALSDAQAALLTNVGQVVSLRAEGKYAFVGMAQSVGTCGNRYWLDIETASGKSAYATAMLAFTTEANVYVRADDNPGTRVFEECFLHDIFVAK
ncbi:MAG TPA: hypothetical protein VGD45_01450 [Steroidobacter sp.]|uniref:hypothetical protein n=1 Tax=Steroidobacter sp. TaxID=1978227 RepID=UPI002ED7F80F